MSEAKSIFIYFYASIPDAAARMLKFVFVYLANTAVLCYSLTISCCCQVQNYIYWIISTENDHRHHHKFIKYEKTIEKRRKKHVRLTYQAQYLQIQREFGRVALPWVRSNGPTDPLHISCICSIWKIQMAGPILNLLWYAKKTYNVKYLDNKYQMYVVLRMK